LVALDHLLFEQRLGERLERVAAVGQDLLAVPCAFVHDLADLGVDLPRGVLGVRAAIDRSRGAEERPRCRPPS
jgi:hypothetical protein